MKGNFVLGLAVGMIGGALVVTKSAAARKLIKTGEKMVKNGGQNSSAFSENVENQG